MYRLWFMRRSMSRGSDSPGVTIDLYFFKVRYLQRTFFVLIDLHLRNPLSLQQIFTMKITKRCSETQAQMYAWDAAGFTIGFIPTMGALHPGHISLIEKARQECDRVVCSIFVNPIQFNNSTDLENYPKTITADLTLLEQTGCDLAFLPENQEIYPEPPKESYTFGGLENLLEGAFRPGHFHGVAVVVKRLFDIVLPQKAYFGEKDYQQLLIIQQLVEQLRLPVEIIPCPVVRESDGLAMSSRNMRLSSDDRQKAPFLYKTMQKAVQMAKNHTPEEIEYWGEQQFAENPAFTLEYFRITDNHHLQPLEAGQLSHDARLLVAAWLGGVRLIDNVKINF